MCILGREGILECFSCQLPNMIQVGENLKIRVFLPKKYQYFGSWGHRQNFIGTRPTSGVQPLVDSYVRSKVHLLISKSFWTFWKCFNNVSGRKCLGRNYMELWHSQSWLCFNEIGVYSDIMCDSKYHYCGS
jgi:hypothetical protein